MPVTKVYSKWSSGNLVFHDGAGTDLLSIESDGTLDIKVASKLTLANTAVTATAAELNALDGITATAAELNILDGVTATAAEINKLDGVDPQIIYLTAQIADISTAGSTFIVMPGCTVTNIWTVIDNAISVANAAITTENNAGTALTNGAITITQSGSAAGDIDTCAPSANNVFTEGQKLEIITDGGSTTACLARVTIKATLTAA